MANGRFHQIGDRGSSLGNRSLICWGCLGLGLGWLVCVCGVPGGLPCPALPCPATVQPLSARNHLRRKEAVQIRTADYWQSQKPKAQNVSLLHALTVLLEYINSNPISIPSD